MIYSWFGYFGGSVPKNDKYKESLLGKLFFRAIKNLDAFI